MGTTASGDYSQWGPAQGAVSRRCSDWMPLRRAVQLYQKRVLALPSDSMLCVA